MAKEEPKIVKPADTFFTDGKWDEAAPKDWWAIFEEGTTFCCIPREPEKRKRKGDNGEDLWVVYSEVTDPGNLMIQKGSDDTDDKEVRPAVAGDFIGVDMKARLSVLRDLADDDKVIWEVKILAVGKVKLDGGKSMWNFKVGKRQLEKRKAAK